MNPLAATRTLPHPLLAYTYPLLMPDTTPPPAPPAASTTASPPPADTKGYPCQWEACDKSLPDPELLYIHLCNDHIGRKSTNNLCLTCKWKGCGATCAKRDHITSHLRVHTPLKPHVCEICSKPFKRPQDLKKHEKIHTEEHHMAHRHSKAITVHDENYVERVRAQAPNAAPPRGMDLNGLHPSLAGLGLPGHNLAYLTGATATREHRSPTLASFAGVQHQYGPGLEFGSVSPRSTDEALTPASARISPMPPHADIGYGWDTPALGKRGRNGSDPSSPSDDFWTDAKKRKFQPTYDAQMAERLSTLSSLGFPPLGAAHPSLSLHPNASSPPSTTSLPSLPLPDPRSAEELAQWNQYLVKLGEQVASSVYAHALGLAPPPPPPPQQYLDPTTLAQFGLAGMPGLLGFGLGLGGLPGLGMLGAAAGGLGGVDYNAIAAYQQAQAQALAVQSQIAAGLYPGLDLATLAAAAAASPAHAAAAAAAHAAATAPNADHEAKHTPPRRPTSSSSRRSLSASASESDFEFDALRPSRAPVPPPVIPGLAGLPGFGPPGASLGLGDKRSVVPLKSAPPAIKEESTDMDVDDRRLSPPKPVEPRLGMRTPGMPAKIPATSGGSSGLYPTLPPSLSSSSSSELSGEKIKLPGIQSLLEPSFRLRPVTSSPSSSSENEDDDDDSTSTATSRAGSPSSQGGTVLPSFASIALNDRPANKDVEERLQHIAVIQAMIVAVNREWIAKHGPAPTSHSPVEERKLEVSRDVEMVA
ncbi:pH-response transcription factor pacC/RIM101 [Cryptococcus neoformans var, neoformans B-3501A] [Rhizoctonia solani]|uniref:pH-response transcription factor pacC/RIM101 [Cryptococcus neoformans var, neoformans B-3501A] n=1 Tax=Rhizoctonia solani TaxID=456999 RepID=A0A0K6G8H3_9AGAM|nr:pH-response transcription factor pacC/RIM101 [Cryptococcus neoformans var, neoformans B-3501A] [Rhizoctonia solani]